MLAPNATHRGTSAARRCCSVPSHNMTLKRSPFQLGAPFSARPSCGGLTASILNNRSRSFRSWSSTVAGCTGRAGGPKDR
eukprot:4329490-Lingulodinium_polyedra.AAC.1